MGVEFAGHDVDGPPFVYVGEFNCGVIQGQPEVEVVAVEFTIVGFFDSIDCFDEALVCAAAQCGEHAAGGV